MDRLILIDGNNLLFRVFYGHRYTLRDKNGLKITGAVAFVRYIYDIQEKFNSKKLLVLFDGENSRDKRGHDENYKANRNKDFGDNPDDDPYIQLPIIKKLLASLMIPYVETDGVEADDVISSYCLQSNLNNIIVSNDTDFYQLLSDNIAIYSDKGVVSEKKFKEDFGFEPSKYSFYKSIVGDPADNISGVKGIGKVGATKLVQEYNDIDHLIDNISNISEKGIRSKLEEGIEDLKHSFNLIDLKKEIYPMDIDIDNLNFTSNRIARRDLINLVNILT